MIKKIMVLGLAGIMAFSLCACGETKTSSSDKSTDIVKEFSEKKAGNTPDATEEPEKEEAETPVEKTDDSKKTDDSTKKEEKPAVSGDILSPDMSKADLPKDCGTYLINNDDYSVEITDTVTNGIFDLEFNAHFENKTEDTVMIWLSGTSINGIMTDPVCYVLLEGESEVDDTISWFDNFDKYGIDDFTVIEGTICVVSNDDYSTLAEERFAIYPEGESKAEYAVFEGDGEIIYEDDAIQIVYRSTEVDDYGDLALNLYLFNKSDSDMVFGVDDSKLNGESIDGTGAYDLGPGKGCYGYISWWESALEDADLESFDDVKTIDVDLYGYDAVSWKNIFEASISIEV